MYRGKGRCTEGKGKQTDCRQNIASLQVFATEVFNMGPLATLLTSQTQSGCHTLNSYVIGSHIKNKPKSVYYNVSSTWPHNYLPLKSHKFWVLVSFKLICIILLPKLMHFWCYKFAKQKYLQNKCFFALLGLNS